MVLSSLCVVFADDGDTTSVSTEVYNEWKDGKFNEGGRGVETAQTGAPVCLAAMQMLDRIDCHFPFLLERVEAFRSMILQDSPSP